MEIEEVLTQKALVNEELNYEDVSWVTIGAANQEPYIRIHCYRREYTINGTTRNLENIASIKFDSFSAVESIKNLSSKRIQSEREAKYSEWFTNAQGELSNRRHDEEPFNRAEFAVEGQVVSFQLWKDSTYLGAVTVPIAEQLEGQELKDENNLRTFKQMLDDLAPSVSGNSSTGTTSEDKNTEYDIFISHASEDKGEVARPLYNKLESQGLKVWIDEQEINIGDSLRGKIDDGLARSRFGVVVLSPDFFKKDWPKAELDALVAKQINQTKTVLQIWHNVNESDVQRHSPMLAGRYALSTSSLSLDEIADEIAQEVQNEE